jgi:hypothetical protein
VPQPTLSGAPKFPLPSYAKFLRRPRAVAPYAPLARARTSRL